MDSNASLQNVLEINSSIDDIGKFLIENEDMCLTKSRAHPQAANDRISILKNQWINRSD